MIKNFYGLGRMLQDNEIVTDEHGTYIIVKLMNVNTYVVDKVGE